MNKANEVKFKLIKKYPNSPDLGHVIVWYPDECIYKSKMEGSNYKLQSSTVEMYPEFWAQLHQINGGSVVSGEHVYYLKDEGDKYIVKQSTYRDRASNISDENLYKRYTDAVEAVNLLNKKDLSHYENELDFQSADKSYRWLKTYEPKLYWLKVLQNIANNFNGNWQPNWKSWKEVKYYIIYSHEMKKYLVDGTHVSKHSLTHFRTPQLANEAIELMGDNLKYIFE